MITIDDKQDIPIRDVECEVIGYIVYDMADKCWLYRVCNGIAYYRSEDLLKITDKLEQLNKALT